MHKAKTITETNEWILFYKPWKGGITARKVLRNKHLNLDIVKIDGNYKVYSSFLINKFKLDSESKCKTESRPYYYLLTYNEVISYFPNDVSLINQLDSNQYSMNELKI